MKKFRPIIVVLGLVLSACGSSTIFAAPTATPTQPKPTSTPTATYTPSPTRTQTPTPTPIGGSEPILAFVGKDSQGNYGLYVDGFYTRKPKKIASVPVSTDTGFSYVYLEMKWSSDGKKLIFVNDEPTKRSFFLYDAIIGEVREIAQVPDRQNAHNLIWLQDGNEIFFHTTSPSNRRARYWKLELSSGKFTETTGTNEFYGTNSYFHINSAINCNNSLPSIKSIKSLDHNNELDRVCFYPDLNSHGALKRGKESTDLVLLSPTGEVDKTLVKFPVGFGTNGSVGLSLSPDKSQILIVGDGGIDVTGHPFAYLVPFTSLTLDKSDPKLFPKEYDPAQDMDVHVYGWSPDGQNYLVASGNRSDYKLAIIQAASGNIIYEYRIPNEIEPAILISQSTQRIDMTWPSER